MLDWRVLRVVGRRHGPCNAARGVADPAAYHRRRRWKRHPQADDRRGPGGDHPTGLAARQPLSGRARDERRLGLLLCAPAAIVILAVTAYPVDRLARALFGSQELDRLEIGAFTAFLGRAERDRRASVA
jgi:hypothetical protein